MKTKLLSLAGALLCAAALSSCVTYDEYGYGYGATPVGGSVYVDDYPDYGYGYGYGGYGYGYAPAYTGVSFFGLGGYPYGRYYGRNYHRHHDDHHHHHYTSRTSANQRYINRVAQPRPGVSSRVTAPRTPSRSTLGELPRSRGGSSSRSFTTPSRSVPSVRSLPRAESRPSPSMRPSRGTTTASFRPSSPAPRASAPASRPSGGGGGRSIESRRSR